MQQRRAATRGRLRIATFVSVGSPQQRAHGGRLPKTVVIGGGICGLAPGSRSRSGPAGHRPRGAGLPRRSRTTLRGATGAGSTSDRTLSSRANQRVLDLFKRSRTTGSRRARRTCASSSAGSTKYPLEALTSRSRCPLFLAARAFATTRWRPSGEAPARKLCVAEGLGGAGHGPHPLRTLLRPYTTKVWGIPPSQLAASFASNRIPHISLMKVITSSLGRVAPKITGERASLRAPGHRALLPAEGRGPHQRPHGRAHQEGEPRQRDADQTLVTRIETQGDRVTGSGAGAVPTTRTAASSRARVGQGDRGNPYAA